MIRRQMLVTCFFIFMLFAVISGVSAEDPATCSTDTIAPTVVSVDPANGSVNVPKDKVITVTFNETINITENTTIELKNSNGVQIPINTSISGNVLTITPQANLLAGVKYTIILENITDELGNGIGLYTSTFTVTPPVMKGYWMHYSDVAGVSAADLLSKGITDVFVLTRGTNGVTHNAELLAAIAKYHNFDIKVHAWIICFKTGSPSYFVDPSGYRTKTYVTTIKYWGWKKKAYTVRKKVKWKKVRGKWKYKWKKVIRYKWRKGWIYKPVYKTVGFYDLSYNNNLVNYIRDTSNYANLNGIHLDYVRYSGVASKGHAAWQEPGGVTAAVNAVTGFVQKVRTAMKPTAQLSAALMPECGNNPSYYGQDYSRLADYLDFLVPMIYEGNYNAGNSWIQSVTSYVVSKAKGKPVYAGFTTYVSDSDTSTADPDLAADVHSAKDGGANGFVLFKYGLIDKYGKLMDTVPEW